MGPDPAPFDPATGDWVQAEAPTAPPPEAPRRGTGPTLWTVLLGIDLALLGVALAGQIIATLAGQDIGLSGEGVDLPTVLWANAAFNLAALGLVPLAWVVGTRVKPWEGAVRYLHLERPLIGLLQGVLWGLAALAALILLGLLAESVGYKAENKEADAILSAMTPALALALAFSAAVGEEIFFRGLLQRKLGLWGQAGLFGLFHLSYGTPLQVIVPALLGLLFGWLIRRGAPLWTPIAAHFVFNYVQLTSQFWLPPGL